MMTEPTTERLARALREAGASPIMIELARRGYYDDFKSELATPCIQLVADLHEAGLMALRARAINGEFDSTREESAAWMEAQGKGLLSTEMLSALGYKPEGRGRGFGK